MSVYEGLEVVSITLATRDTSTHVALIWPRTWTAFLHSWRGLDVWLCAICISIHEHDR